MKTINGYFDIFYPERMVAAGHASDKELRFGYKGTIEVNFIVFLSDIKDIYLIQIDTLFVDIPFKIGIEEELKRVGIRIDVICVASHSHSLPGIDLCKPALGACNSDYRNFLKEKIVKNIKETIIDEGLTEVSFSRSKKYSWLSIGRRGSRSKNNFSLLRLRNSVPDFSNLGAYIEITCFWDRNKSRIFAIIWTFPAHPVLNPNEREFSADFPGCVRDLLREELGDKSLTVLYFPGCAGDMRPLIKAQTAQKTLLDFIVGQSFKKCNANDFKKYCVSLKADLIECMENNKNDEKKKSLKLVDYQKKQIPLEKIGFRSESCKFLRVELIKFNNISSFAFLNCEPSHAYHDLFENDCTVTGYSSGVFGYLPTDEQIKQGGYEVTGFLSFFGTSGCFVRGIRKIIKDECIIN